jgi:hypothetical protein
MASGRAGGPHTEFGLSDVFPIGVILFRRSLEFARKMGLLSGY